MRKEIVLIVILLVIFTVKILGPSNEVDMVNMGGSAGSQSSSESTVDNITEETNEDKLNLESSTIETLTIDEETGQSCNEYIPRLLETGSSSYTISPQNTIFDYFCSQTIGGSNYDELDLSGYDNPPLVDNYFEGTSMNSGTEYISISNFSEDIYLVCYLNTNPGTLKADDTQGEWTNINCDLSTIDSHAYFTPQKILDKATNQYVLTDVELENGYYSEYKEEFNKIEYWYGENGYFTVESFLTNLPSEEDLDLHIIDYNLLKDTLEVLQAEVRTSYQT